MLWTPYRIRCPFSNRSSMTTAIPCTSMDQIRDMKNTDARWIENLSLSEAMKKLSPREQHILDMRFFQGKTQMEVADEISISQAQVSRLEKNALNYMKKYV